MTAIFGNDIMPDRRCDIAAWSGFSSYAICAFIVPILLVTMGKELHFPLDRGGMASGGALHLVRSIAMTVSLLSCGMIAGKFGTRRPLGVAVLLMGCGITGCALASSYAWLPILLLLSGLGEGICEGLLTPFVHDRHPETPERHVNIAHSFWSVGIGICVLAAGAALRVGTSWRIIIAAAGLTGLLSSFLFFRSGSTAPENGKKENGTEAATFRSGLGAILRAPRFWLYSAGMFVGAGAEFGLTFWAAAYLQLKFGAAPLTAGLGTATIALGMFVGRNVFGRISKPGNLPIILIAASIGTIPPTLLLAVMKAEYFGGTTAMYAVLLGVLFCCGVGISPFWPTLQVYGVSRLPELDPTLLYICFSAIGVPGCGFFTWLIGALGDRVQLHGALLSVPVMLLIYAGIIAADLLILRRKKS